MFGSRFMPCPECGASLDRRSLQEHECSPERWVDLRMFELRDEIAQLEDGVRRFLSTTSGRFESWLASRQVRDQA